MTPKNTEENKVCYPAEDVIFTAGCLIAASSQLRAIADRYAKYGQLRSGAILHVSGIIDEVIDKLYLDTAEIDQLTLPF